MSFPFSRTLGAGIHIISVTDSNILCDTSSGAVNLVLPKISEVLNNVKKQGYSVGAVGVFPLYVTDISNNASTNNITIVANTGDSYSNNLSSVVIKTNNGSVAVKPVSEINWSVLKSQEASPFTLTTNGTSGASALSGDSLNIPIYQSQFNLTTNGTGGASTFNGTTLNIPNYLPSGLLFMGAWNANTNDPFLQSGVGVSGQYYIVSVAGNTNLDGVTDWNVGDWAIFESATNAWQKIDNHEIISYNTIQEEGVSLPPQTILDFQGSGVTATNGSGKTIVTIPSITSDYLRGNTLTVDAVYGNDTNAALNPNSVPFLTIGAALAAALSGNNVIVNAGTYNEVITIPAGVCLTGASTQAVTIQKLGVTANTTLITLNNNSRMENVTCNLSSSGNYNLVGVEYVSGASITAKIRTSVINVTSTTINSPSIIGALSSGTSSTAYSATDAIARTTINVISSSTGLSRGVYVNGANRFTIRETNIYARGTGSNIIGFECNDASCVTAIRTSTIDGLLYDVNRALGTMLIGGTDLVNNTANGNSFTATQAPASFSFGTINGLATNRRYYMLTGTVPVGQLVNEATSNSYDPAKALPVPVTQVSLVIAVTMAYQPALTVGTSITLNIYKNSSLTPEIALTMLPADGGLKRLDTQSFSLNTLDVIRVTLETTGNVGAGGAFQAVIGYY